MALHGGLSFCKTQQVVGFDCTGIERLYCSAKLLSLTGRAYISVSALSQARRGPTVTQLPWLFYTPRGRAAIRNPWP